MAEAAAPNIPSDASTYTTPKSLNTPSIPSPTGKPQVIDFLKPDNPRKRRRSGDGPESAVVSPKFSVSPPTLTAAQALIDQRKQNQVQETIVNRQTSPNPAIAALSVLQGRQMVSDKNSQNVLSSPSAGAETIEPAAAAIPSIQQPDESRAGVTQRQRSFTQPSGFGPAGEDASPAVMDGNGIAVASPGRIDETMGNDEDNSGDLGVHRPRRQETDPGESRSDKALTYPGPLPNYQQVDRRRNTHSGFGRDSPSKSPGSNKKHQCAGGCAGRRSSLGGDDLEQDESMPGNTFTRAHFTATILIVVIGLMYTGEASHEPEKMDDETDVGSSRKGSLPSIQRHEATSYTSSDGHSTYSARPPSTYPPIVGRQPNPGGLYPPMASPGGGSSTSNSPRQASFSQSSSGPTFPPPPSNQNVFSQGGGMTESPKPLSPGSHQLGHPEQSTHRNRSPSLTQQFQQQQFGRKPSMQNTPPGVGLPPIPASGHPGAPHLPSLPSLPPPDLRFTLHSQAGAPAPVHPTAQGSGPTASSPGYQSQSGNNSLSSQSGDGSQNVYNSESARLYAYIRSLEVKIDRLQEEVGTLKSQLSGSR
ncbi:MAG: hypothetical protein Q9224_000522 [Gallowayella concinna]